MKGEFQNFSQYYQIFPPMRSLLDNSYTEDEVSSAGLFLAGSFIHWAFNKFETSLCKDFVR